MYKNIGDLYIYGMDIYTLPIHYTWIGVVKSYVMDWCRHVYIWNGYI